MLDASASRFPEVDLGSRSYRQLPLSRRGGHRYLAMSFLGSPNANLIPPRCNDELIIGCYLL